MSEAPHLVIERSLARARSTYAKHAIGWTVVGLPAAVLSASTFESATRVSGMLGGVAFALPVGIWMAVLFYRTRPDGPLGRLLKVEPTRIVWHFVRQHSVHSRSGAEMRRTYQIAVARDDGKRFAFVIEEAWVERVQEALRELAPHATEGWSDANEDLFADDPKAMLKVRAPEGGAYRDAPAADAKPIRRGRRQRARRIRRRLLVGIPAALLAVQVVGSAWTASRLASRAAARQAAVDALFSTVARERTAVREAARTPMGPEPLREACSARVMAPLAIYFPSARLPNDWKEGEEYGTVRSFGSDVAPRSASPAYRVDRSFGRYFLRAFFTAPWSWGTYVEGYSDETSVPNERLLAVVYAPFATEEDERARVPASAFVRITNRDDAKAVCTGTVVLPPRKSKALGPACAVFPVRPTATMRRLCEEEREQDRLDAVREAVLGDLGALVGAKLE